MITWRHCIREWWVFHSWLASLRWGGGKWWTLCWRKLLEIQRSIALLESDYNQAKRLLLARPLSWLLEDNNAIPDMQFGSRAGKLCQSAVINKQMTFEIIRMTKETAVFIENDAVGCFDRIVNPFVLIFLLSLGVQKSVLHSLAATWKSTVHYIKTQYGVSSKGYENTGKSLQIGPGQGATLGPYLWLLCFILIYNCMRENTPWLHHATVDNSNTISHLGESFVDDMNLGCIYSTLSSLPKMQIHNPAEKFNISLYRLHNIAQEWERLLFSTGGALNLQKSFWFVFSWEWI